MRIGHRILVSAVCIALGASVPVPAQERPSEHDSRLIRVSGLAEIRVMPDEARVKFEVSTSAKTLALAKADHDNRSKRVMELVQSFGVEPKDIQTSSLSMGPKHEMVKERMVMVGYEVEQTLNVRIRDLKKYEEIVTGLLEAGITRIQDVDFLSSELQKHKAEAYLVAVRAAKNKAAAMAAELGSTLGRPHFVAEEESERWLPAQGDLRANTVVGYSGPGGGGSTVAPGELVVRARVIVSFELK